ncbi:MAG: hypothetical protein R6X02_35050 [Enhygromyxa sp.]
MPGRLASLGLLVLLGSCTRVPADVSSPTSNPPAETPTKTAAESATNEAIPQHCVGSELDLCARSCHDSACLEWCAGQSCATTLASLWSCMRVAEERFIAERPYPELESVELTDEQGETYRIPSEESYQQQDAWHLDLEDTLDERWRASCEATCLESLAEGPSDRGFCADWDATFHTWKQVSKPPPEQDAMLGLLGGGGYASLGLLLPGTVIQLGAVPSGGNDPRLSTLANLVGRASVKLDDAARCVPGVDQNGSEFGYELELDASGRVGAARLIDGPLDQGECVGEMLAGALQLPIRVAREYPRFELRVLVRPTPDWGIGGLTGIGDWSGVEDSFGGSLEGLEGIEGIGTGGGGYGEMGLGGGGDGGGGGGGSGMGTIGGGSRSTTKDDDQR